MTALRAGAATDVGMVRATNQDNLLIATPLFAVADGMGGHAAGEVASEVAVRALEHAYDDGGEGTSEGLGAAARAANRAVWDRAQSDPDLRGMGTTLVALAFVDEQERLAIANVGDSRAYRWRDGRLEQLTTDHNLVQELLDEGLVTEEEAPFHPQRNVVTRALGVDPDVDVDVIEVVPRRGDRFLLCSDGLGLEVEEEEVSSVLGRLADPDAAAHELVREARENGGKDNITVVVVDVVDDGEEGETTTEGKAAAVTAEAVAAPEAVGTEQGDTQAVAVVNDAPAPPPEELDAPEDDPELADAQPAASPPAPKERVFTFRVALFLIALLIVLAAAVVGVGIYARGTYFVGLSGNQVVIYQGRPGGVLWFQPTIKQRTSVTVSQVLPARVGTLRAGQVESSVGAANQYVARLRNEAATAQGQNAAGSATTTTVPTLAPAFPTSTTAAPR